MSPDTAAVPRGGNIFDNPQTALPEGTEINQATLKQLMQGGRPFTETVRNGNASSDPAAKVMAFVRPGRNWGGAPAGSRVEVTQHELDIDSATLCTPTEYARITRQQSSVEHQSVQKQLASIRQACTDAFNRGLTPEKAAELEAARKRASDLDDRDLRLRQEVAQLANEVRVQGVQPAPPPPPGNAVELEARIAEIVRSTEQAKAGASPRMIERLDQVAQDEIAELRAEFARQAPPPAATGYVEQRLVQLKDLYTRGLISGEAMEKRQAEILRDL